MKYLVFSFMLILSGQAMAQDSLLLNKSADSSIRMFVPVNEILVSNMAFMDCLKDSKLIKVNTYDPYFQRTYLITKQGETLSSGYMPSSYFVPNDNFIVISGKYTNKDSFNPYGASDFASALFFGTFNNFISKLKINRR